MLSTLFFDERNELPCKRISYSHNKNGNYKEEEEEENVIESEKEEDVFAPPPPPPPPPNAISNAMAIKQSGSVNVTEVNATILWWIRDCNISNNPANNADPLHDINRNIIHDLERNKNGEAHNGANNGNALSCHVKLLALNNTTHATLYHRSDCTFSVIDLPYYVYDISSLLCLNVVEVTQTQTLSNNTSLALVWLTRSLQCGYVLLSLHRTRDVQNRLVLEASSPVRTIMQPLPSSILQTLCNEGSIWKSSNNYKSNRNYNKNNKTTNSKEIAQDSNYVSACILSCNAHRTHDLNIAINETRKINNVVGGNNNNKNTNSNVHTNELESSWNAHDDTSDQNNIIVATLVVTNGQHVWSLNIDAQRNTYGPVNELNEEMYIKTSMREEVQNKQRKHYVTRRERIAAICHKLQNKYLENESENNVIDEDEDTDGCCKEELKYIKPIQRFDEELCDSGEDEEDEYDQQEECKDETTSQSTWTKFGLKRWLSPWKSIRQQEEQEQFEKENNSEEYSVNEEIIKESKRNDNYEYTRPSRLRTRPCTSQISGASLKRRFLAISSIENCDYVAVLKWNGMIEVYDSALQPVRYIAIGLLPNDTTNMYATYNYESESKDNACEAESKRNYKKNNSKYNSLPISTSLSMAVMNVVNNSVSLCVYCNYDDHQRVMWVVLPQVQHCKYEQVALQCFVELTLPTRSCVPVCGAITNNGTELCLVWHNNSFNKSNRNDLHSKTDRKIKEEMYGEAAQEQLCVAPSLCSLTETYSDHMQSSSVMQMMTACLTSDGVLQSVTNNHYYICNGEIVNCTNTRKKSNNNMNNNKSSLPWTQCAMERPNMQIIPQENSFMVLTEQEIYNNTRVYVLEQLHMNTSDTWPELECKKQVHKTHSTFPSTANKSDKLPSIDTIANNVLMQVNYPFCIEEKTVNSVTKQECKEKVNNALSHSLLTLKNEYGYLQSGWKERSLLCLIPSSANYDVCQANDYISFNCPLFAAGWCVVQRCTNGHCLLSRALTNILHEVSVEEELSKLHIILHDACSTSNIPMSELATSELLTCKSNVVHTIKLALSTNYSFNDDNDNNNKSCTQIQTFAFMSNVLNSVINPNTNYNTNISSMINDFLNNNNNNCSNMKTTSASCQYNRLYIYNTVHRSLQSRVAFLTVCYVACLAYEQHEIVYGQHNEQLLEEEEEEKEENIPISRVLTLLREIITLLVAAIHTLRAAQAHVVNVIHVFEPNVTDAILQTMLPPMPRVIVESTCELNYAEISKFVVHVASTLWRSSSSSSSSSLHCSYPVCEMWCCRLQTRYPILHHFTLLLQLTNSALSPHVIAMGISGNNNPCTINCDVMSSCTCVASALSLLPMDVQYELLVHEGLLCVNTPITLSSSGIVQQPEKMMPHNINSNYNNNTIRTESEQQSLTSAFALLTAQHIKLFISQMPSMSSKLYLASVLRSIVPPMGLRSVNGYLPVLENYLYPQLLMLIQFTRSELCKLENKRESNDYDDVVYNAVSKVSIALAELQMNTLLTLAWKYSDGKRIHVSLAAQHVHSVTCSTSNEVYNYCFTYLYKSLQLAEELHNTRTWHLCSVHILDRLLWTACESDIAMNELTLSNVHNPIIHQILTELWMTKAEKSIMLYSNICFCNEEYDYGKLHRIRSFERGINGLYTFFMKEHAYGQCAAVMTSLASLLYCSMSKKIADLANENKEVINNNRNTDDMIRPCNAIISDIISGSSDSNAVTVSKLCALALHAAECITDSAHDQHDNNNNKNRTECEIKCCKSILHSVFTRSAIPFLRLKLFIAHCEGTIMRYNRYTRNYDSLWSNDNVLLYYTNVNENVKLVNSLRHLVHALISIREYTDAFRLTRLWAANDMNRSPESQDCVRESCNVLTVWARDLILHNGGCCFDARHDNIDIDINTNTTDEYDDGNDDDKEEKRSEEAVRAFMRHQWNILIGLCAEVSSAENRYAGFTEVMRSALTVNYFKTPHELQVAHAKANPYSAITSLLNVFHYYKHRLQEIRHKLENEEEEEEEQEQYANKKLTTNSKSEGNMQVDEYDVKEQWENYATHTNDQDNNTKANGKLNNAEQEEEPQCGNIQGECISESDAGYVIEDESETDMNANSDKCVEFVELSMWAVWTDAARWTMELIEQYGSTSTTINESLSMNIDTISRSSNYAPFTAGVLDDLMSNGQLFLQNSSLWEKTTKLNTKSVAEQLVKQCNVLQNNNDYVNYIEQLFNW